MYEQLYLAAGIIIGFVIFYAAPLLGSIIGQIFDLETKNKIKLAERRLKILREMKNPEDRIVYIKNWMEHDIENWKRKLD